MEELGWVGLPIRPDFSGFESRVKAEARGLSGAAAESGRSFGTGFGTKATSAIHEHFTAAAKYIVGPLVGAFAVEKIGDLIGESLKGASDLEAARNRIHLIFGPESAKEIDEWGEHAAQTFGIAHQAALGAASGFGLLGQKAGLSSEENEKFSVRFTKLAQDLAAFNHSDPASAVTALQRGLGGATRGLKPYGILIDSAAVQAEALNTGLLKPVKNQAAIHAAQVRVLADQQAYTAAVTEHGKQSLEAQKADASLGTAQDTLSKATAGAVPPLTQQQKILAASKLIMQQSTTQQGAFKRSSGDLWEQQQKLSAWWDNAKDRLGHGLMPIATDFVHMLNQKLVPAVDDASRWFDHKGAPALHHFESQARPLAESVLPAMATGIHDAYKAAEKLEPVVKGIFDGFNKLPGPLQSAIVVGGTAAYLGKKTGLLSKGGSLISSTVGRATPVPVFVTNWGGKLPPGDPSPDNPGLWTKIGGAAEKWAGPAAVTASGAEVTLGSAASGAAAAFALPIALTALGLWEQRNDKPYGDHTTDPGVARGGPAAAARYAPPSTAPPRNSNPYSRGYFPVTDPAAGAPALVSTATKADALRNSLAIATRQMDLVGPHADAAFGKAGADVVALSKRINAIPNGKFTVQADTAEALARIAAVRYQEDQLHDKTIIIRTTGGHVPGDPGAPTTPPTHSGNSGAGTGPTHVHIHLDDDGKRTLTGIMDDSYQRNRDADDRYNRAQAGRIR